jgi:hypothetical protein
VARRWMRRVIRAAAHPLAMELGCALLRTPPLRAVAEHVFFSRGSFPDIAPWRTALGSRLSAVGPHRP